MAAQLSFAKTQSSLQHCLLTDRQTAVDFVALNCMCTCTTCTNSQPSRMASAHCFVCYLFFYCSVWTAEGHHTFCRYSLQQPSLFGSRMLLQLGCLFLVGISGHYRSHGHLEQEHSTLFILIDNREKQLNNQDCLSVRSRRQHYQATLSPSDHYHKRTTSNNLPTTS